MKRIIILLLFVLAFANTESKASSRKERAPKNGEAGWVVKQLDGEKLVWYSFRGEMYDAPQFINVLSLDLNCKDYELDFVVLDRGDSLSSVATKHRLSRPMEKFIPISHYPQTICVSGNTRVQ